MNGPLSLVAALALVGCSAGGATLTVVIDGEGKVAVFSRRTTENARNAQAADELARNPQAPGDPWETCTSATDPCTYDETSGGADLVAIAPEGWTFKEWRGEPCAGGGTALASIDLAGTSRTCTAVFQQEGDELRIKVYGDGLVSSSDPVVSCRDECTVFVPRKPPAASPVIELFAHPGTDDAFIGWNEGGTPAGAANPHEYTLQGAEQADFIEAFFEEQTREPCFDTEDCEGGKVCKEDLCVACIDGTDDGMCGPREHCSGGRCVDKPASCTAPVLTGEALWGGGYDTCLRTASDAISCFGSNAHFLVDSTLHQPTVVDLAPLTPADIAGIPFGLDSFNACVHTVQDQVWCWGRLGSGSTRFPPTYVAGLSARTFGFEGRRGHAADASGNAWEFSFNSSGVPTFRPYEWEDTQGQKHQVTGVAEMDFVFWRTTAGNVSYRSTDVKLVRDAGGVPVSNVVALLHGTCALTEDGHVWCWEGSSNTTAIERTVFPETVQRLFGDQGSGHEGRLKGTMCGIDTADGAVWCQGNNENGQLGDGTRDDAVLPVKVSGLTGVTDLSVATDTACARKSDGTVWCWGRLFNEIETAPAWIGCTP